MKLELQNLSFSYGTQEILHDLSFSVAEGEFVSLLGPSGCGKSTILKLLTGVLTPSDGSIRTDGKRNPRHNRSFRLYAARMTFSSVENDSGQRLPLWGNPRFAGTCP